MDAEIAGLAVDERALAELAGRGFTVLAPVTASDLRAAYDHAVDRAPRQDVSLGRSGSSLRVLDLVSAGPELDPLYVEPRMLALARRLVNAPIQLSSMLARTVLPGAANQELHRDWSGDDVDAPRLVSFIVPVDDFDAENGATRFVPGSHRLGCAPADVMDDTRAAHPGEVVAVASAGSCILYDGRVWHGFTAHRGHHLRRSVQGAFIRRDELPGVDQRPRLTPATRARISPLARYLLAVE